jgi:hypothetical protein
MVTITILRKRKQKIQNQISKNLDVIIGTLGKSPAMKQHNLTTKVNGKTVTRYVRNGLVPQVKKMTLRHQKVKNLMQELSLINWELLKLESKEKTWI